MRRLMILFLCLLLLTGTVSAADQATSIQSTTTVGTDGSCQVTMIVAIHLDKGDDSLVFPLPADARSVKLNNTRARCTYTDDAVEVSLSKVTGGAAGDFTLTFSYQLEQAVHTEEEIGQVLTVPLLQGFAYPVEQLEFSVTLPGPFEAKPTFSSGYHQESIESSITYSINGATVNGVLSDRLQDHETLAMRLLVPAELFPTVTVAAHENGPYQLAMAVFFLLALLYWFLKMRCLPLHRVHCSTPPEGITAGEIGCRLTLRGADLTLMVLSWAQLGYLSIRMDQRGRVFLHRRMNMGNERSAFENHYFHLLFAKKQVVTGTGHRYANLCRRVENEHPGVKNGLLAGSGNPKFFLLLTSLVGLAAGAAVGSALGMTTIMRILLAAVLGLGGCYGSLQIQKLTQRLFLRPPAILWPGLVSMAVFLLLSLLSGQPVMGLTAVLLQLLAGVMASYGGRRTDLGRQTANEILGLRRYLRTVSYEELQRIVSSNPDYYFEMAPYALALGVDKAFAARFQKLSQPSCTYLSLGKDVPRSASDWQQQLSRVTEILDAAQLKKKQKRK